MKGSVYSQFGVQSLLQEKECLCYDHCFFLKYFESIILTIAFSPEFKIIAIVLFIYRIAG